MKDAIIIFAGIFVGAFCVGLGLLVSILNDRRR